METWRPVVGYEDAYEVSDKGRVRSRDRLVPAGPGGHGRRLLVGRILKPGTMNKYGHLSVAIGKGNSKCVHDLVLRAFVGPPPPGTEACHRDTDGSNNDLDNLRWGTKSDNWKDVIRIGRERFTFADADVIRVLAANGFRTGEIAKDYGVSHTTISQIVHNRIYVE